MELCSRLSCGRKLMMRFLPRNVDLYSVGETPSSRWTSNCNSNSRALWRQGSQLVLYNLAYLAAPVANLLLLEA